MKLPDLNCEAAGRGLSRSRAQGRTGPLIRCASRLDLALIRPPLIFLEF